MYRLLQYLIPLIIASIFEKGLHLSNFRPKYVKHIFRHQNRDNIFFYYTSPEFPIQNFHRRTTDIL